MPEIRPHRRRRAARVALRAAASAIRSFESLETRLCFSSVLPAFSDQLGLTGLVDPNTTFEDTFDGSSLDTTKWQVREGPRWRLVKNGSLADMTYTSKDAVRVGGGNLEIAAFNNAATGHLETGWIQSSNAFLAKYPDGVALPKLADGYSGNFQQVYGYWEARVKFSSLPGEEAGFWVHSYKMTEIAHDATRTNQPDVYGAEYDIAEHGAIVNGANAAYNVGQTAHWNGYSEYQQSVGTQTTTSNYGPSYTDPSQFHVYGMLWTSGGVKFTVDGNVTYVLTDPNGISKVAQQLIFSSEAGAPGALEPNKGNNYWGTVPAGGYGDIDSTQARVTVDYVRVWKMLGQADPTPNTNGGTIFGTVFNDVDGNQLIGATEQPTANQTIWIDLDKDGQLDNGEPSQVTGADGKYSFSNLPAGIYTLRRVNDGKWATQTGPITDADASISLSGPVTASLDFGVSNSTTGTGTGTTGGGGTTTTPPPANTATIVGSVMNDANGNGRIDAGETAQGGIGVYLDYNMNGTRDTATEPLVTSAADGSYKFTGVNVVNALAVRLALAGSGYTQTLPNGASDAQWLATIAGVTHTLNAFGVRSTSAGTTTGGTGTTPGTSGGGTTTTIPTGGGSLAAVWGSVFDDADKNGLRGAGETGKANVSVYLDYNFNGKRDSDEPLTATAADGTWAFSGVRVTNALAIQVLLAGTGLTQTLPANSAAIWVATAAGRVQNVGSFGVNGPTAGGSGAGTTGTSGGTTGGTGTTTPPSTGTASVTGLVYNDANKNGSHDNGEAGLANVRVYLDANMNGARDANETITALTAADGTYRLDGIKPAAAAAIRVDLGGTSYTQTSTAGAGARWIAPTAGTVHAGNDFGVASSSSTTGGGGGGTTTTGGGTTSTGGTATLSGTVFADTNKDGVKQSNEGWAVSVIVYVDANFNGRRDANELYGIVDASGAWRITNVPASGANAIRTTLSDGDYRMTTVSGDNARWLATTAGNTFGNIAIGIAPR